MGDATRHDVLSVLVVQPHRLVCQALVRAIDGEGDLRVVAHTDQPPMAVALAAELRPDVVVVDSSALEDGGSEFIATLKASAAASKVLVMAPEIDRRRVERTLVAGADGFTLTTVHLDEFLQTVRRVASGEIALHPGVTSAVIRSVTEFATGQRGAAPTLTDRQLEILELLSRGLPNKLIARNLGIGVETVKTHISRILAKLGVESRTEAAMVAVREGFVVPHADRSRAASEPSI